MTEKPKGKPKNDAGEDIPWYAKYLIIILLVWIGIYCLAIAVGTIGPLLWRTIFPQLHNVCEHYLTDTNAYRIQTYHQGLQGNFFRYESTTDSRKNWTQFYEYRSEGLWADCEAKFYSVSENTSYFLFPPDTGYNTTIVSTNDAGQSWHIWDSRDNEEDWLEDYYCAELYDIQFQDALHGSFRQECSTFGRGDDFYYEYITSDGGETWELVND